MQAFAKSILISILVSVCILMFTNLIFFFPWYMALVVETFNLSQIAAADNYVKQSYYTDTLDRLKERPIFEKKPEKIKITVTNKAGASAIGVDNENWYFDLAEVNKPYRQRGEPIVVRIDAVYPLSITVWGEEIEREIEVSFSLQTTGLKHYKDLPYYQ